MSSNDGTRPTDAYESLLAHHFFPVSLNWLASRGRTFLGRMLLVNQANDHGEITGTGIADAVAYDAEDRIEVIVDWKSGVDIDAERLNSYHRQLGAYRRPRSRVYQQCVCRETHCWPVSEGFRACFRRLGAAVDARISPADKV